MALIERSDYGLIAVNDNVVASMIADRMSAFEGRIYPCSKKGKLLKNGFIRGTADALSSISLREYKGRLDIEIFYIMQFGESINDTANDIFDCIEDVLAMLGLGKPDTLTAHICGIMTKQVIERNLEVVRNNGGDLES